ncbi:hypothetical protein RclHR1_04030006 [Rhizophagus clarus]|uniref:Uncharacterized protein n=1 Tax=Rhizophagus clarus TaxID=94130 RepID=A0A2Z6RGE8_9GLOM|nr:hypothetical protein RclHR1_04030006 [Rhizophagus clarus]GES85228.1 hypothetical protein GLOIN_2v1486086 [Rhizophagus clarus]
MLTKLILAHCVPKGVVWKSKLMWIHKHNYSILPNNRDVNRFGIDLKEIDNFPEVKNTVIRAMFEFQNNLWRELFEHQIKFLDEKLRESHEKKEAEKLDIQEKKEAEKLMLQKEKEVERFVYQKEHEAEKSKLFRENVDQMIDLKTQIERLRNEVEKYKQQCTIEFIRAQQMQQVLVRNAKPLNKILEHLSQDKQFTSFLEKVCENNHIQYNDVQKSADNLRHTVSTFFNNYNPYVNIIDAQSWTSNEVLLLGAIYHHYKIPFIYHDNEHKLVNYPYRF